MFDLNAITEMAADYTAAWNSISAEAVASFFAENGIITIYKGGALEGPFARSRYGRGLFRGCTRLNATM